MRDTDSSLALAKRRRILRRVAAVGFLGVVPGLLVACNSAPIAGDPRSPTTATASTDPGSPSASTSPSASVQPTASSPSSPPAASPSPSPPASLSASGAAGSATPSAAPAIPAKLRGTWTIASKGDPSPTAAQCRFGQATAGKLIEIDARTIQYFETEAVLRTVVESDATSMSGQFQEQVGDTLATRTLTLQAQDDAQILVISEAGEDADTGPQRYARCPD